MFESPVKQNQSRLIIYTVGHKNVVGLLYFCQYLRRLLTNFQNSLDGTLCHMCAIKNFESRSNIGEDMNKRKVPRFLAHPV